MRLGVDTGGTFTDFALERDGSLSFYKIPSTPQNPAEAVCRGIQELIREPVPGLQVLHGTTVATNAFLERRGSRTALVTTRGFRDLLFIGRQNRPELYNFKVTRPEPFLRPSWIFEVPERTLADGSIRRRPTSRDLEKLRERLLRGRFASLAVAFLHSYANPENEELAARALEDLDMPASLSSAILPEFREYERLTTTCINAYLRPLLSRYLFELNRRLAPALLRVQQSAGGHLTIQEAAALPVQTVLSGPAGGLAGARALADLLGEPRIITFDMGGTSTDVALSDGKLPYTREYQLDGFPVSVQVLDIHTIGAGGGSIAWIDAGGALKVGPWSAGADPGPICYGKGQDLTVTDAHLFLGRLVPETFLGGRLQLEPERTRRHLQRFASRLGLSPLLAAEGIIRVANANMSRALKAVSLERGHDPRDYVLFCLGGASGLHACELALDLNIRRIILPLATGVLSALGMLAAGHRRDLSRTVLLDDHDLQGTSLEALFGKLEAEGRRELQQSGTPDPDLSTSWKLDIRYRGQSYEITVPYTRDFRETFQEEHRKLFGYALPDAALEVTTLRLVLEAPPPPLSFPRLLAGKGEAADHRRIFYGGAFLEATIVNRAALPPEMPLSGPALILDEESTCFVTPEFVAQADVHGNLHLERKM